jgi:hypothetical protein
MRAGHISLKLAASGEIRLAVMPLERGAKVKSREASVSTEAKKCKKEGQESPLPARSGYGGLPRVTSFNRNGRRRVMEHATALEKTFGKDACMFGTLTLPASTEEAFETLARYSGWVINRMNQWMRDTAPGVHYLFVWELQKRGALHAHFIFAHSDARLLTRVVGHWKNNWCHILSQLSEMTGIDMFKRDEDVTWKNDWEYVQADVKPVTKSVAAYLAKYLSKSESKSSRANTYYPSRWWGASKETKALSWQLSEVAVSVLMPLEEACSKAAELAGRFADAVGALFHFENPYLVGAETWIARVSGSNAEVVYDWLKSSLPVVSQQLQRVPVLDWRLLPKIRGRNGQVQHAQEGIGHGDRGSASCECSTGRARSWYGIGTGARLPACCTDGPRESQSA